MPSRAKSNAVIGGKVVVGGKGGLYNPPIGEIGARYVPTPLKGMVRKFV